LFFWKLKVSWCLACAFSNRPTSRSYLVPRKPPEMLEFDLGWVETVVELVALQFNLYLSELDRLCLLILIKSGPGFSLRALVLLLLGFFTVTFEALLRLGVGLRDHR